MYNLLIVDDDVHFLASLERVLGSDFVVKKVSDGDAARKALMDEPDLVLLDIRLNEEDSGNQEGVELLKQFVQGRPGMPIIMMSAYGDVDTAVECMQVGATDFIKKPFNINAYQTAMFFMHH